MVRTLGHLLTSCVHTRTNIAVFFSFVGGRRHSPGELLAHPRLLANNCLMFGLHFKELAHTKLELRAHGHHQPHRLVSSHVGSFMVFSTRLTTFSRSFRARCSSSSDLFIFLLSCRHKSNRSLMLSTVIFTASIVSACALTYLILFNIHLC